METANGKRKHDASGAQGSSLKKSKGGNQGKWMTTSHKAKLASLKGRNLEVGDVGFWVTCQRHKEMRAADEILSICDDYGQKLFGIIPEDASGDDEQNQRGEDEPEEAIEDVIEKELAAMKSKAANGSSGNSAGKPSDAPFDLLKMNVDCVLFMRTRAPVDPLTLVREICKDAAVAADRSLWRSRFINKLTPVTFTGKANDKGLEEVTRKVLAGHFRLAADEGEGEATGAAGSDGNDSEESFCSYAIRPTLRAHTTLKRGEVIDKVASMISKKHKVELTNPDKVIIIEIFQTFCGMSVVGKDWEAMKRYNIHELYIEASKSSANADKENEEDEDSSEKPGVVSKPVGGE